MYLCLVEFTLYRIYIMRMTDLPLTDIRTYRGTSGYGGIAAALRGLDILLRRNKACC
ncbi:hypothetical protein [Paenibacillus ihumii]|uniref:hypothetical protein n=1 Tax=Paenibacillus ihumii TaxID=687436 RepID=UPI000A4C42F8|nr:hypothetical protein [Paenibacillus ihumii]